MEKGRYCGPLPRVLFAFRVWYTIPMTEKKITTISLVITGLALAAIIVLLISAKHRMGAAGISGTATNQDQPASVCYALHNETAGGTDTATLKLTTTDGEHATGQFNVALAQKDASTGVLDGVISITGPSTALFDGHYVNMQEGMNNTSEQLIKLDQNEAQIGYGEMVQNADGGYDYKDKSAVMYSLSLPRVDCATQ